MMGDSDQDEYFEAEDSLPDVPDRKRRSGEKYYQDDEEGEPNFSSCLILANHQQFCHKKVTNCQQFCHKNLEVPNLNFCKI